MKAEECTMAGDSMQLAVDRDDLDLIRQGLRTILNLRRYSFVEVRGNDDGLDIQRMTDLLHRVEAALRCETALRSESA